MKKNLFLGMSLLAIAGLWTGCSNDEGVNISPQGKAISFGVQGGVPEVKTKTTATTTDYVNAFVVSGSDDKFGMGDPANTGHTAATGALFRNFSIARSTDASYDYNPKRYFSNDAENARFFAYSPVSKYLYYSKEDAEKIGTPEAAEARPGANAYDLLDDYNAVGTEDDDVASVTFYYEVPMLDDEKGNTTQEDLLIAWADVPDLDAHAKGSENINLNFVHALSRVFVTGQNKTASPVRITNLQFNNLCNKGQATITGSTKNLNKTSNLTTIIDWAVDATSIIRDDYSETDRSKVGDYRYELPESGIALKASKHGQVTEEPVYLVSKEQGMMVIPQKLETLVEDTPFNPTDQGNIFSLRVDYELSNLILTDYITLDYGTDFSFAPGKQYKINIVFEGREINFDIDVAEFGDPAVVTWADAKVVPTP